MIINGVFTDEAIWRCPKKSAAMPSDVRKAFGLPASEAIWNLGYAKFLGRSPESFRKLDGSAERFRTSVGIAESSE